VSESVLDTMVAKVITQKQAKEMKLTPVGSEPGGPLAGLPNDVPGVFMSNEAMADIARDLRRKADVLVAVADGLDVILGIRPDEKAAEALALNAKLAEREADRQVADRAKAAEGDARAAARVEGLPASPEAEAFKKEYEAKSAAAQASTFGWACPEHGSDNLKTLTSRLGRTYRACTQCKEFEKP